MRTYVLIFIGMIVFGELYGQFKPGQMLYNGHFSLSSRESNSEHTNLLGEANSSSKSHMFELGATAGVFITENFMLGIGGNYHLNTQKNEYVLEQAEGVLSNTQAMSSLSISIGLEARRYFTLTEKAFFVLQGQGSYSNNKQKTELTSIVEPYGDPPDVSSQLSESTSNSFILSIRPGLAFALSSNLFLEAFFGRLSYSHQLSTNQDNKETSESSSSQFFASFSSMDLRIGVSLVL